LALSFIGLIGLEADGFSQLAFFTSVINLSMSVLSFVLGEVLSFLSRWFRDPLASVALHLSSPSRVD